jgi:hypothetical protein
MSLIEPIIFNEQGKYFQIKINAGQQIFKSGGVIRLSDLEYEVSSATTQGESYKVFFNYDEGRFNCECLNFLKIKKYNGIAGQCKHCLAVIESIGLIQ